MYCYTPMMNICFHTLRQVCSPAHSQINQSKRKEAKSREPEGKRERNHSRRQEMYCLQVFDDSYTHNKESRCQCPRSYMAAAGHPCNAEQPQSNSKKMSGEDLAVRNRVPKHEEGRHSQRSHQPTCREKASGVEESNDKHSKAKEKRPYGK